MGKDEDLSASLNARICVIKRGKGACSPEKLRVPNTWRDRLVSREKRYISEARLPDAAKAMLKMIR